MSLPTPPKKKDKPAVSMLDKNREVEGQEAQAEALRLPDVTTEPTGKFTVSPITLATLDDFEDVYRELKKQRRTLKRYQLAEALLASIKEPAVLAEIVKRLR